MRAANRCSLAADRIVMLTPGQLRQRYLARQRRLALEADERAADDRQRSLATSAEAVAEAIARAKARREKR